MSLAFQMSKSLTIGQLSARAGRQYPNKECMVVNEKRYFFKQFDERVNCLANAFICLGLSENAKVAVLSLNCAEVVETYFAAAKVGAIVVPLNFRLTPPEMVYIITNSDSELLVIGKDFLPIIEGVKDKIPHVKTIIVIGGDEKEEMQSYEKLISGQAPIAPVIIVDENAPAFIIYTSGTTGNPKGALLTHKNLIINGMNCIIALRGSRDDAAIVVMPLFHAAGIGAVIQSIYMASKCVIHDMFDPIKILQTVQDEKITNLVLVPTMWNVLLNHPSFQNYKLDSLKVAATGGAIMPLEMKNKLLKSFPYAGIYDAFGQTEMGLSTTMLSAEDALYKPESVGRPLADIEIRVVDENMQDVPVGEVGEIVYRGPTLMREYYKNPEATAEAFKGGWFHSGDLVRMDEEGYVYIVDRKKDMIISGGENIYPAEVEKVLNEHPKVFEAAVIGVPNEHWGESVLAVVTVKPGEIMTEDEINQHCLEYLARYKRPRRVEFMDAIPKNASGKILKTELRKTFSKPQMTIVEALKI